MSGHARDQDPETDANASPHKSDELDPVDRDWIARRSAVAPLVLGARGRPAVGDLPWDRLAEAPRFRRVTIAEFGPDLCETYERI